MDARKNRHVGKPIMAVVVVKSLCKNDLHLVKNFFFKYVSLVDVY